MKRLSLVLCALAATFVATSAARADYHIVGLPGGACEIWSENGGPPWGDGWVILASNLPDHETAWRLRESLYRERICS